MRGGNGNRASDSSGGGGGAGASAGGGAQQRQEMVANKKAKQKQQSGEANGNGSNYFINLPTAFTHTSFIASNSKSYNFSSNFNFYFYTAGGAAALLAGGIPEDVDGADEVIKAPAADQPASNGAPPQADANGA